jgi:hypothetical protein
MAQPAETLNCERGGQASIGLVPARSTTPERARARNLINELKAQFADGYHRTKVGAADSYLALRRKLDSLKTRTTKTCNEKPVQIVALAAGTAFVLGFAVRIWRWKTK